MNSCRKPILGRQMLRVRGLSSGYGDLVVLRNIDLDVKAGEFVGIIGSNAAGKSTFVRAMVGLLPRLTGTIEFDGCEVSDLAAYQVAERGMAVVLEHTVIGRLPVEENLLLGAYRKAARTIQFHNLTFVVSRLIFAPWRLCVRFVFL